MHLLDIMFLVLHLQLRLLVFLELTKTPLASLVVQMLLLVTMLIQLLQQLKLHVH